MRVRMSSLQKTNEFLDHEKCNNATQYPQSHRHHVTVSRSCDTQQLLCTVSTQILEKQKKTHNI